MPLKPQLQEGGVRPSYSFLAVQEDFDMIFRQHFREKQKKRE